VPETSLLGRIGDGLKIGLISLDTDRIGIAAQAAFENSVTYAKERQKFSRPISKFQTIQNYLSDMATKVDTAKNMMLNDISGMLKSSRFMKGPAKFRRWSLPDLF
jgi:butyryl-CoA dehydrogenase